MIIAGFGAANSKSSFRLHTNLTELTSTIASRWYPIGNRNNHPARHTVPIGVLPGSGSREHLPGRCQDLLGPRPGQNIRPHLDRLRPLGILPEGDAGHAQDTRLLLDAAGVGQDEAGVGLKLEKFEEPDRVHGGYPIERNPELLDHLPGAGVHREDDGERVLPVDRLKPRDDAPEGIGVVDVLLPVGGDEEVALRLQSKVLEDVCPPLRDLTVLEDRVDDGVPGHRDLVLLDALLLEVLPCGLRGGKEVVRDVIRDHPVDLLGHRPVKAPEAGLDMADADVEFCGRKSPGHDGVGVALDEDDVGFLLHEDLLDAGQDLSGLPGMGSGTDIEVVLRLGQVKVLEERPVHVVGVVLPGVEDEVIEVPCFAFPDDRGHLDDLRSGSKYNCNHGVHSFDAPDPFVIITSEFRISPDVTSINPRISAANPPVKTM